MSGVAVRRVMRAGGEEREGKIGRSGETRGKEGRVEQGREGRSKGREIERRGMKDTERRRMNKRR